MRSPVELDAPVPVLRRGPDDAPAPEPDPERGLLTRERLLLLIGVPPGRTYDCVPVVRSGAAAEVAAAGVTPMRAGADAPTRLGSAPGLAPRLLLRLRSNLPLPPVLPPEFAPAALLFPPGVRSIINIQ